MKDIVLKEMKEGYKQCDSDDEDFALEDEVMMGPAEVEAMK